MSICAVLIIALCIGMSVRRNSDSYLYGLLDDGNVSKISELYVSNYSKMQINNQILLIKSIHMPSRILMNMLMTV